MHPFSLLAAPRRSQSEAVLQAGHEQVVFLPPQVDPPVGRGQMQARVIGGAEGVAGRGNGEMAIFGEELQLPSVDPFALIGNENRSLTWTAPRCCNEWAMAAPAPPNTPA